MKRSKNFVPLNKYHIGIIGGGIGSFAGPLHRIATLMSDRVKEISGAPEEDPEKAIITGKFLNFKRTYRDWKTMLKEESKKPSNDRIDLIIVATPNNTHYSIVKAFIEQGFPVVCEKPLCLSSKEAREIDEIVKKKNIPFMLIHNYSGYPLVKEMRKIIENGKLGKIHQIFVEYIQGWLIPPLDKKRMKQISWRLNPEKAGISTCLTDIGSHAEHLARYITRLGIEKVCADLSFYKGRVLSDSANILVRYSNNAKGFFNISQTSTGEENNLKIRIYGSKAGIEWSQQEPNSFLLKHKDKPTKIIRAGSVYVGDEAKKNTRIPAGHPEGFLEAFSNLYVEYFKALDYFYEKKYVDNKKFDYPSSKDGLETMKFIEACVESDFLGQIWRVVKK